MWCAVITFESLIMFGSNTSTLMGLPATFWSLSKTWIEYTPTARGQYVILKSCCTIAVISRTYWGVFWKSPWNSTLNFCLAVWNNRSSWVHDPQRNSLHQQLLVVDGKNSIPVFKNKINQCYFWYWFECSTTAETKILRLLSSEFSLFIFKPSCFVSTRQMSAFSTLYH